LSDVDRGYDRITAVSENLSQFDDRPVFIGWGLKDFVFDKHFLAVWEQTLPSAEVVRYEDAGHYVLEDVGDELIERIVGFLDAHPVDAPSGAAE
jgi:haloalkane dehalogenase